MKNIRKALALVLALVMTFALSVGALADWSKAEYADHATFKTLADLPEDLTGKTVILHTNDIHGRLAQYAYIAGLRTELETKGAEVILADVGDFSQGSPYVSTNKGEAAVTMMNVAKYDIVTLGNHEFDFGYEQMVANMEKAEFKVICADVTKDGAAVLDPTYVLETKAGLKLGFFGMETPETASKVNPGMIQGVNFLNNANGKTDLFDCAALQVENLKKDGVDLVIGLFHLGVDDESKTDGHRSIDVYGKAEGIDFIIDGHSHTVMTAGENGEPIQSTGEYGANLGVVIIDNAAKKVEDNFLLATQTKDEEGNVTGELPKDETVAAAAQAIIDEVDAKYGAVFAKSEITLTGEQQPGNRSQETSNGDIITDAMKWSVLKEEGAVTVDKENVVAITNGGGIRAAINVGDVTMKDINTVLPFGSTVAVVYVTGTELLEALEASTFCTPTKIGGYPQTAGIKFTIDTTKEYDQGDLYLKADGSETTYYAPKTINRVTIESINGVAFDPEATYAVVTNNFCAAGGDTYNVFMKASAQFDTGIPLDEALMAYIEEELGGVISASKYAFSDGEQTQIPAVSNVGGYSDVDASLWYAAALRYVTEGKVMTGIGTGKFNPNGTITYAEVMKLLANMAGADTTPAAGEQWYDKAVAWAKENGIADVTNPTNVIPRENLVVALYNYAKFAGVDVSVGEDTNILSYSDATSISEGAFEAFQWACGAGVINGTGNGLEPQGTATRASMAQILLNYSKAAVATAETVEEAA